MLLTFSTLLELPTQGSCRLHSVAFLSAALLAVSSSISIVFSAVRGVASGRQSKRYIVELSATNNKDGKQYFLPRKVAKKDIKLLL